MIKIRVILTLSFIFFVALFGYAQGGFEPDYVIVDSYSVGDFRQLSKHQFQYNTNIGPLHSFKYVFEQDDELKFLFHGFDKSRRNEITGNVVSGALIVGAGLFGGFVANDVDFDFGVGFLIGSVVIGLPLGLVNSIIVLASSKKNKNLYRSNLLTRIDPGFVYTELPGRTLELALTQHGIGLVYSF